MSDLIKLQKSAATKTLLYIDGDKTTQNNYGIYFQKSFKNFFQAFDGQEGFDQFLEHKPDVVILNLALDKMDAIELISEIQEGNENIIIIVISDECENYDLLQTLDMGLDKILLKPVGFAKIAHLLISLLPPPIKPKPTEKREPIVKQVLEKAPIETPKIDINKKENIGVVKQVLQTEKVIEKPLPKQEKKVIVKKEQKPIVKKTDAEISFEIIEELAAKKTLVEFINSYKGIMVLHDGTITNVNKESFEIKVNIAQILAAKSEKQILIKTQDNKYIHAQLVGIDLKNTMLKLIKPRLLEYKQRNKEYSRIMADNSFKASIYFKKKHIDFKVSYISFHSAVLLTDNVEIDLKSGDIIDITLGFDISGPNAMIRDKKFTKVFAKCEVLRVDQKIDQQQIVIQLNVNKAGERTLKKYLSERESELIYEFKSRIRR